MSDKKKKTLELDEDSVSPLTVLLNIELRDSENGDGESLNEVFKQLTGKDHQYWGMICGKNRNTHAMSGRKK
tara:strand:+ start:531 stop:746 length:216 start_codon:yes stop_codon:yes gene_type:complete